MFDKSIMARLGAILAGGLMLGAASTANASLIGDMVDVRIGVGGLVQPNRTYARTIVIGLTARVNPVGTVLA